MEKTLVLIKPDGVERGLIGEIITRFEKKGLKISAMKILTMSRSLAEEHYAEHIGKPFYERLVKFMTSGPIVAMVLEGREAIKVVRKLAGATDPVEAEPGTIRGDFSVSEPANTLHASDSMESAEREIKRFFPELYGEQKSSDDLARENKQLKREIEVLRKRADWYESQSQKMEELIAQYNQLVKKEFDNVENVIGKIGTKEVIDPITRLYSRDHMLNYLNFFHSKAFQESIDYALIFVDVDDFEKKIKELSNEEKEILLREIGKFLKNMVRVPLDIVSRLGEDEFLILLTQISKDAAISVANRINSTCQKSEFKLGEKSVKLTCTVSLVHFPTDNSQLSNMLKIGEKLIEEGKKRGKNSVMFN